MVRHIHPPSYSVTKLMFSLKHINSQSVAKHRFDPKAAAKLTLVLGTWIQPSYKMASAHA